MATSGLLSMSSVLVHGGFVDGSGWAAVYKTLKQDGYDVAVVQNPTVSLSDDVAVTRRTIATQHRPVLLVGHSYGGGVITEAGIDPNVAGLVYIAAFAPDKGESVSSLIKEPPPGAPGPSDSTPRRMTSSSSTRGNSSSPSPPTSMPTRPRRNWALYQLDMACFASRERGVVRCGEWMKTRIMRPIVSTSALGFDQRGDPS